MGYNCWSARSRNDFPALSLAALTTPSLPLMSFATIPRFHFPLFLSSLWIRTTSPSLICGSSFLWLRLCLSLKLLMYSPVHRAHNTSLQRRRYLAHFLKSLLSIETGSSSGNRLGWPNIMAFGVSVGSWTSSSR